jgi:hypothetical protein
MMTRIKTPYLLLLAGLCATFTPTVYASDEVPSQTATIAPALAPYNVELFNLLLNRKNVVTGVNGFNKEFAASFDKLLREALPNGSAQDHAFLKKRLLSGPEGTPRSLTVNGKQYLAYDACQAHACDQTRLTLLYAVQSKAMFAALRIDGVPQILGHPAPAEQALLKQP